MNNNQNKAALTLEGLCFEDIQYTRNANSRTIPKEYEMNFTRQIVEAEDHLHFKVSLTANIWSNEEDNAKARITLVGFFFCDYEDEEIKKSLILNNTIAIMYPYLRSQVTLVSTQPNIPPIMLQPINIIELFKDAEQKA